jgi:hypothetical protein
MIMTGRHGMYLFMASHVSMHSPVSVPPPCLTLLLLKTSREIIACRVARALDTVLMALL